MDAEKTGESKQLAVVNHRTNKVTRKEVRRVNETEEAKEKWELPRDLRYPTDPGGQFPKKKTRRSWKCVLSTYIENAPAQCTNCSRKRERDGASKGAIRRVERNPSMLLDDRRQNQLNGQQANGNCSYKFPSELIAWLYMRIYVHLIQF